MKTKKRKSHYQTGTHTSSKSELPINFRSGWERDVCIFLDHDPNVLYYAYETVKVPYVARIKPVKWRTYYPDFLVGYSDGVVKMIEVKRLDKQLTKRVLQKTAAAKLWCEKNNIVFEMWTDAKIKEIRTIILEFAGDTKG